MRWIERVSGLLAGLLAVVAGLLSFQLPAARIFASVSCGVGCTESSVEYGPSVSASAHNAMILPVALTVVAALAIALVALLDAQRPAHSFALVALALAATIVCAAGAGALLAGNTALVFAAPPLRHSGLIMQYNAGALFIPALVAAIICAIAVLWPRRANQAHTAR
ncbi:MAG TPA: hypothetical protein VFQ25_06875 [Ktedonobacterales bacterium]|nr:hypothetical protein [Ktedonobacterales bacterium]